MTKGWLALVYPAVLLAWILNLAFGRDPLRLYDPPGGKSCWTKRRAQPNTASYFSEESCAEGPGDSSAAKSLTRLLDLIARLYRPSRQLTGVIYKASAEREQGVPDEVYTLW
jgi:hypothetical protein